MKSIKLIISETPPPSAQEVATNIDLITDVLLRLPIKSLIRFKSVSKQWLSLISDPKFHLRRKHSPSYPSGLFLHRSSSEYDFIDLSPNPTRPPFRSIIFGNVRSEVNIVDSCNGLLLCCSYSTPRNYYVYNPTTNRHNTLPPPTDPHNISCISLAFDPSKSPHYKAICVRSTNDECTRHLIDIYSSETGAWRPSSLGFFETELCMLFDGGGKFWNGSVHWIGGWWGTSHYFNVEDETVHEMPAHPESDNMDNEDRSLYYAESGDHFHLVDAVLGTEESCFNVYELEKDYSGWFLKYVVDFSELSMAFPEMNVFYSSNANDQLSRPDGYVFSVLCIVRCAVEEESYLVMNIPGQAFKYSFEKGTFVKLCDGLVLKYRYECITAYQFIESLACV